MKSAKKPLTRLNAGRGFRIQICLLQSRTIHRQRRCCYVIATAATAPQADAPPLRTEKRSVEPLPMVERGMKPLPEPSEYQQTLFTSFTLGGVGLHTAEYAHVRVRPAFAGEGRYFIRVPEGTNEKHFWVLPDEWVPEEKVQEAENPPLVLEEERLKIDLFQQYLRACEDDGFEGEFPDWLETVDNESAATLATIEREKELIYGLQELEEPVARSPDESVIEASINSAIVGHPFTLCLGDPQGEYIVGAELLLSALEACGVDNCRIEIEGGTEIPNLDGSAQPWALEIQQAGITSAHLPGSPDLVPRSAAKVSEVISIFDNGRFISVYPDDTFRVSACIDAGPEAPIFGRQWFTHCLLDDEHYRFSVAPARAWAPSRDWLLEQTDEGFFQGAAENCFVIANNDRFSDLQLVRFTDDECARHELARLIGLVALSAQPGSAGLPLGHVVSYQATLDMQIAFVKLMTDALKPDMYVSLPELGKEADLEMAGEEGNLEEEEEYEDEDGEEDAEVDQ